MLAAVAENHFSSHVMWLEFNCNWKIYETNKFSFYYSEFDMRILIAGNNYRKLASI